MAKEKKIPQNVSTEEKIKEAARKVFIRKGYSATRTRDIAEEADINLALLNYYFRSKEKLFQVIMTEKMEKLFGTITPILTDPDTSLEKKVELLAKNQIALLMENPDLPIFVLSEMRNRPEEFLSKVNIMQLVQQSDFAMQLKQKRPDINPLHFVLSVLGMIIFPFILQPVFMASGEISSKKFRAFAEERKALIPKWTKAMLGTK